MRLAVQCGVLSALLLAPTASAQSDATVWLDVKRENLRCDGDATNVVVRVTRFGEPLRATTSTHGDAEFPFSPRSFR